MTQDNAHDLPGLLKLVEDEGIDRFYFSHLNYAGRGNKNRKDDALHKLTRWAMDLLFDTCWEYQQRGLEKEFTTGNNDADGPYLLHWVQRRFPEKRAAHPEAKLRAVGRQFLAASTSPTSTTSAMCIPTPCGGITHWATCASGRSRRSGRIPPTR
jgi:MoaA/NifB/PqqE/SkfB family radical SAM enzyme